MPGIISSSDCKSGTDACSNDFQRRSDKIVRTRRLKGNNLVDVCKKENVEKERKLRDRGGKAHGFDLPSLLEEFTGATTRLPDSKQKKCPLERSICCSLYVCHSWPGTFAQWPGAADERGRRGRGASDERCCAAVLS
jgi:hypothetical protein